RLLERVITEYRPNVVLSSSTPLDAQASALAATFGVGGKFVFWLQDIQGIAIKQLLGKKVYGAARFIGDYYTSLEKRLLRRSNAVVAITDAFIPTLTKWEVPRERIHVVPNWASMDELP